MKGPQGARHRSNGVDLGSTPFLINMAVQVHNWGLRTVAVRASGPRGPPPAGPLPTGRHRHALAHVAM